GIEYLSDLTSFGVLSTNARHYATIIEEKSMLRRLIRSSTQILDRGYENEEADTLLEFAEQTIFDISQKKNRMGLEPIREVLIKAYERIEKLFASKLSITGLSTGFKDLDFKLSGLQKSDLVLVAARPSMGKTAFALNVCQNAALRNDASVAVFSLEMSKEQLVQRMLSSEAQIPMQNLRNGKLVEDDWVALTKAMSKLSAAKIHIDDTPSITPLELRAKCRRLKMEKGLDLIMIDYLQLMNVSGRSESRQQEISLISRSLKAIAREMDCPVVALSQLSRAPELRSDHRPMLSDLRESGAIEQDADVVMFLYRDEYYDKESERKNIADLIIAKQRNGEIGDVELVWLGQFAKFADKARYVDESVF
ncbi:MAG: replicative DNA helicase, partial [Erysipelotrichaceae bacterium]|nr:replicative DNA helicase [Erysipelotrichaceae bacterium]